MYNAPFWVTLHDFRALNPHIRTVHLHVSMLENRVLNWTDEKEVWTREKSWIGASNSQPKGVLDSVGMARTKDGRS
jgi:hypothetical protein